LLPNSQPVYRIPLGREESDSETPSSSTDDRRSWSTDSVCTSPSFSVHKMKKVKDSSSDKYIARMIEKELQWTKRQVVTKSKDVATEFLHMGALPPNTFGMGHNTLEYPSNKSLSSAE